MFPDLWRRMAKAVTAAIVVVVATMLAEALESEFAGSGSDDDTDLGDET